MAWTPDQPLVSIRDVHLAFGSVQVLNGISLDVMQGGVVCIIGPSGAGKSTLLRCVNALVPIDRGSILVEGQEVHDAKLDKLKLRQPAGSHASATTAFFSGSMRAKRSFAESTQKRLTENERSTNGLGERLAIVERRFVMIAPAQTYAGSQVYASDFLPGAHQGTLVVPGDEPVANVAPRVPSNRQELEQG